MAKKSKSIYENTIQLEGDATMTLSAQERMMIVGALTKCAPDEADVLPIIVLMDRMTKGV